MFLPANYEKGKSYPTIVYIYEKLSNGLNKYTAPTANGFNKSVYTSNGYAVLDARHQVQGQRSGPLRRLVRAARPGSRGGYGRGGQEQSRPARPFLGRLPNRLPDHPDRRLQSRDCRRAA